MPKAIAKDSDFLSVDLTDWFFNINSGPQMQRFLYQFLNLTPLQEANDKGNLKVDEEALTHFAENDSIAFCTMLLAYKKLQKAKGTYLDDIERNISFDDWRLHGEFWLNTTSTFRSSSTNPNMQNIPKHGDMINGVSWKTIRKLLSRCDKTEKDFWLAEVDYDGAEVKVAGMLGGDKQMQEDLNNDLDLHSHWAIELFGLKGMSYKEVKAKYDDTYRFLAKNNFTFADIFGAIHKSIAAEMRKSEFYKEYVYAIYNQRQIKNESFDTFFVTFSEEQVERCQNARKERYPVYTAWQEGIVQKYYKEGYVENPFGFRRRYPLKRNEIINYPIQSTSFLLLLDSLISVEDETRKGNWRSKILSQVHDSAVPKIHKVEFGDYIDMVNQFMVDKPHLPWTKTVKMKTDWSFGLNWYNMISAKSNRGKACMQILKNKYN